MQKALEKYMSELESEPLAATEKSTPVIQAAALAKEVAKRRFVKKIRSIIKDWAEKKDEAWAAEVAALDAEDGAKSKTKKARK